jgi:hypothetical protein
MKKLFFAFLMLGLIITSCGGGNPAGRANDLCACAKDAGIDFDGIKNERDLERLGRKVKKLSRKDEKEAKKCILEVMKGVQADVKDMNDKETAQYMRSLAKSALDTECAIEAMEDAEYDDMKDILDDMVDELEDDID